MTAKANDLRVDERAAELLAGALARCAAAAPSAIAVFDLDSTLLDNRPRQAAILREFGAERGIAELAAARAAHWRSWSFRDPMRAVGLSDARIEAILPDFKAYWDERFFTSAYCRLDVPIAGAPEYVAAVVATGARVCYVTGRHEGMREGTEVSFRAGGFPQHDGDGVRLIMKPTLDETDDDFKARTHAALRALGPVAVAFDNEPTHINDYLRAFPDAMLVHLATDHSPRDVAVAAGIPSLLDFSAYSAG
jgi:hypothetical protein